MPWNAQCHKSAFSLAAIFNPQPQRDTSAIDWLIEPVLVGLRTIHPDLLSVGVAALVGTINLCAVEERKNYRRMRVDVAQPVVVSFFASINTLRSGATWEIEVIQNLPMDWQPPMPLQPRKSRGLLLFSPQDTEQ